MTTTPVHLVAVEQAPDLFDAPVTYPSHGTEHSLGGTPHDLGAHHHQYGERPTARTADDLLAELEQVALDGRGGAHFPTARKWRAVLADGPGGTVVVNGAEGEPASAKDAALLQHRPHLVLDGLAAAAEAVGATDAVVWLHDGATTTHRAVTRALAERRAVGLPDPVVRILTAPDRYLSGEATSVMSALRGEAALPTFVRDPARPWGAGNRPVLLHNADTMARIGLVARGAAGYGGGSLVTVVGPDRRVVCEVPSGVTTHQVVRSAWPSATPPVSVLLGGYGGTWVSWDAIAALPLEHAALRSVGLSLGAGVVAPLPAGVCGLRETARVLAYLADSSARQCGPCMRGLPSLAALADSLARGDASRGDARRIDLLVAQVSGRGACRHPDGAMRMFTSALTTFADDVAAHRNGRCLHGTQGAPVLPLPTAVA